MKYAKHILLKIRDALVIAYQLTLFIIPTTFLLVCAEKDITNPFFIMGCLFLFWLPSMCHVGVFGDKLKSIADKLMGYNDNQGRKVTNREELQDENTYC